MKSDFKSLVRLCLGIFIFTYGIALSIQADLGFAPWDVFHHGISTSLDITFGQSTMVVGLGIIGLNYLLKESIGVGTILNIIGIGTLIDIFLFNNLLPNTESIYLRYVMIISGIVIVAFGSWLTLSAELGSSPRDGLMLSIVRITTRPISIVRTAIELSALIIGMILGGKVGVGTMVIAFGIGPIIQIVFKFVKFDVKKIEHRYIRVK